MSSAIRFLILTALVASVSACAEKKVEETVWDDQVKALEKAREVEQELMQRAGQLSEDLDPNKKDDKDPPN